MKKIFHLLLFVGLIFLCLTKSHCREVVVRTNIQYGITATPNSSIEAILGKKRILDCQVFCNPCILISKEKKEKKHRLKQPYLCLWNIEPSERNFLESYNISQLFLTCHSDKSFTTNNIVERLSGKRYLKQNFTHSIKRTHPSYKKDKCIIYAFPNKYAKKGERH